MPKIARSADGSPEGVPLAAAATLLGTLLAFAPAWAHKLNVFAAAEGTRIDGQAYFAGGGEASGARILVTDAAGRVLAELTPAADGSFSYRAAAPIEHRIVAETLDGHRAEWRIDAAELGGAFSAPEARVSPAAQGSSRAVAEGVTRGLAGTGPSPAAAGLLDPAVEDAIERAVARQVRPLREEMLAARDAVRFRDVLGGIGYLFGLAGLGFWWHGRRREKGR